MATKQGAAGAKPKQAGEYAEGSIRVLKGLEPVKQRPGMYTRTDNPLHIVQEVIDVLAVLNALRAALPPRQLTDFG